MVFFQEPFRVIDCPLFLSLRVFDSQRRLGFLERSLKRLITLLAPEVIGPRVFAAGDAVILPSGRGNLCSRHGG